MAWTERGIGKAVVHQLFQRRVLAIPNCNWVGHECDLLVIHAGNMKLIEVEIKTSRADLLADADKDKWLEPWLWTQRHGDQRERSPWPRRIWKHYYCMPAAIWKPELAAQVNPASGILLVSHTDAGHVLVRAARRTTANPKAQPITPSQALDIARLAGLRMWDAIGELDRELAVRFALPDIKITLPTPEQVMATGNHRIAVFKDGKLIAADDQVYVNPSEEGK